MRDITLTSESKEEKRKISRAKKQIAVFDDMADGKSFSAACKDNHTTSELIEEVLPADSVFSEALRQVGLTDKYMANRLKKLMKSKSMKIDKNGEVHESEDNTTRLKALELWVKITGAAAPNKSESKSLNLKKDLSDDELDSLLSKSDERSQTRETKKKS